MTDYTVEKRKREIEDGFAEYLWLAIYLTKEMLHEFQKVEDPAYSFFLSGTDSFCHMEVMWLLGKNGEYLGEVDDFEDLSDESILSFKVRRETIQKALERVSGETFYLLKNRNYTHAVLYKAPEKKSLLQYLHEVVRH